MMGSLTEADVQIGIGVGREHLGAELRVGINRAQAGREPAGIDIAEEADEETRSEAGAGAGEVDPLAAVARDDVARARGRAADRILAPGVDGNPIDRVAERNSAGGIGADVISDDQVLVRLSIQVHAVEGILGDDIAGAGRRPADRVARVLTKATPSPVPDAVPAAPSR